MYVVQSKMNKRESFVCKSSPVKNSDPHLLAHRWKLVNKNQNRKQNKKKQK